MADLWAGLWPAWGAPVHSGLAAHTASAAPRVPATGLWSAGDGLGAPGRVPSRENPWFSPIPSTTPITTDPYL